MKIPELFQLFDHTSDTIVTQLTRYREYSRLKPDIHNRRSLKVLLISIQVP